jgi:putative redox protein
VCAADHLREQFAAPSILIGHSLGGAAVLAVAHQVPEVRAVATIGAPADPGHIAHLFRDGHADIDERGEAEVCLAGRTFRIRRQFLDDIAAQPQADHIRRLGSALLVLHSPTDETVEVDNAQRIFDTARHPKSFVAIDGADHLLTRRADATYVATVLAAWAGRYTDALGTRPRRGTPERGRSSCPRVAPARTVRTSRLAGMCWPLTNQSRSARTAARHRMTCCWPAWARARR